MPRVNVWIPEDIHNQVRAAGLNVSQAATEGLRRALLTPEQVRQEAQRILDAHRLPTDLDLPPIPEPDTIPCPHPGYRTGASGLLVCKRCGQPKPRTT